jgi:hypothetical protein
VEILQLPRSRHCRLATVSQLNKLNQSPSHSYFTTSGLPPISASWRKPLETHDLYFFQTNTCCHSPYVTSFLMRGWVYRVKLLLALASAVILRSEFPRTHVHILQSRFETTPRWRTRARYLYPSETGCSNYTPRHWGSFSSPPTTRRITVELFDSASTRLQLNWILNLSNC